MKGPTERHGVGGGDPTPIPTEGRADCGSGWGLVFLDAAYHPSGQQRLGLAAAIAWGVARTPTRDLALQRLLERPFNTNGMLAGLAAGPLIRGIVVGAATPRNRAQADGQPEGRAEAHAEVHAVGRRDEPAGHPADSTTVAMDRAVGSLAPLVASIGDRLVMGALLPALSVVLILSALCWHPALLSVYLLVYCGIQVYWRRLGWRFGVGGEAQVLRLLRARPFDRWMTALRSIARFVLGFLVGGMLVAQGEASGWTVSAIFAVLLTLGWALARKGRLGPRRIGGLVLALSLLWLGAFRLL